MFQPRRRGKEHAEESNIQHSTPNAEVGNGLPCSGTRHLTRDTRLSTLHLMRIIGGQYRRAEIAAPRDRQTRPMTGLVRGAIFNILGDDVVEAAALDLFAGSGSLGLEALSRGAACCVFVELRADAARLIQQNVQALRVGQRSRVIVGTALRLLPDKIGGPFDLVFIDPPYSLARSLDQGSTVGRVLSNLMSGALLKERAVVVVRTPKHSGEPWTPDGLAVDDVRYYGHDAVRFLRRSSPLAERETERYPAAGGGAWDG
jgi:16S rRNA (guanine966-N2)-methyltransferase